MSSAPCKPAPPLAKPESRLKAGLVAVGTAVACCPPHRPVLALLTHTVLTSDVGMFDVKAHGCFAHTLQPAGPAFPARCPARVRPWHVLLGQRPSLHTLRRRPAVFVRMLRQYYAAVRLPAAVHEGLIAHRVLPPARRLATTGDNGASRFSRMEFLCMLGVFDSAGLRHARAIACSHRRLPCCLTPSAPRNAGFRSSILSLQIPLSNASSAALRPPPHGSGPGWFATPSLYDSLIRYSMPVYLGAIQAVRPNLVSRLQRVHRRELPRIRLARDICAAGRIHGDGDAAGDAAPPE